MSDVPLPAELLRLTDGAGLSKLSSLRPDGLYKQFTIFPPRDALNALAFTTFAAGIHARHTGKANIGWFDGHAKSTSVIGPPPAVPGQKILPADLAKNNLGYLQHSRCVWINNYDPCLDYYYRPDSQKSLP